MSEKDYNRCDRECEKIFEDRQREAEIEFAAEIKSTEERERLEKEQKLMALRAKQKQAYREGCWMTSFVSGVSLALCVMFACKENVWMAVMAGFFSLLLGLTCAFLEPMAYGYCGKRVKK